MNLHRADEKTIVILSRPVDEREEVAEATAVRICKVGEKKTVVDLVTKIELGQAVSKRAARANSKKLLATATGAAYYFDNLLGSAEASGEDGRRFGEQLMQRVLGRKEGMSKDEAVRDFIATNKALGELVEQHAFLRTLLYAAVRNKLRRNTAKEGEVKSKEEAKGWEIGSTLTKTMLVTTSPIHAVEEWSESFPEVREILREHIWVRPMFSEITTQLFRNTKIGMKARVTVGAVTSMTDLVTDLYVTYAFWSDDKGGYFKASLASLMASIGIQLLLVYFQNKSFGWKRVAREWFPILFGFKPAVDAYRVAKGEKQEAGTTVPPVIELLGMKIVEMFAEAIPGVIIQLMAIATTTEGEEVSKAAWFSLAVSAITTGFASATISYDMDTNPEGRASAPDFYGYVPSSAMGRSVVFASLILMSAAMLLIRCMTIVVLGLIGGRWPFVYIGADLGLYMIVKVLRGDFWYWIPFGGSTEFVASMIVRPLVKIVTDFTSVVQMRHPGEVGGLYWTFGCLLTMVSLPVAITLAENLEETEELKSGTQIAWTVVAVFIPFTVVCFAVFFLNINRKYLHTFWSTKRSKDMSMDYFRKGKRDAVKIEVFCNSRHHWASIEDEIRKWVESSWDKWEEEEPEWFTDVTKAQVPVEFIPTTGDARRRESVRRASVDAEAEGGLGGALRASVRRASIGSAFGDVARVAPETVKQS